MSISSGRRMTRRGDPSDSIVNADKRLQWVERRILTSFRPLYKSLDPRRAFEDDDLRREVMIFFESDAIRSLYIYVIRGQVVMTSAMAPEMGSLAASKKFLVLRKTPGNNEKVSVDNIGRVLSIHEMSSNVVESQYVLVRDVFSHLIRHTDLELPGPAKHGVEESMFSLMQHAYTFSGVVNGKTYLALPRPLRQKKDRASRTPLANALSPTVGGASGSGVLPQQGAVNLRAAADAAADFHATEHLAAEWVAQLRALVSADDDTVGRYHAAGSFEVVTGVNPLDEWHYWNWRKGDLEGVVRQMTLPTFQEPLAMLATKNSSYHGTLVALQKQVQYTLDDAVSVCRWLAPLVQHFESLELSCPGRTDFSELVSHNVFPILMHLLFLVWAHNDVYGTNTRLGSLITGICDTVVEYANYYLMLDQYFCSDTLEVKERLSTVYDTCGHLKSAYFTFKTRATEVESKDWRIPHKTIFFNLDRFLERCRDLLAVLDIKTQLAWLATVEVGYVEGAALQAIIADANKDFAAAMQQFAATAIPTMKSVFPTFDRCVEDLNKTVQSMRLRIATAVTTHVENLALIAVLPRQLASLRPFFASSPAFEPQWNACLALTWKKWKEELRLLQKLLPDTKVGVALYSDLDVPSTTTQRLTAAAATLRRLSDTAAELLVLVPPSATDQDLSDDLAEAIVLYNAVGGRYVAVLEELLQVWGGTLPPVLERLNQPVLTAEMEDISVCLDNAIVTAMREAQQVTTIICSLSSPIGAPPMPAVAAAVGLAPLSPRLVLPPEATRLLASCGKLWDLYIRLFNAVAILNQQQHGMLNYQREILRDEVIRVERVMSAGVDAVTWGSGDALELFCRNCEVAVAQLGNVLALLDDSVAAIRAVFGELVTPPAAPTTVPGVGAKAVATASTTTPAKSLGATTSGSSPSDPAQGDRTAHDEDCFLALPLLVSRVGNRTMTLDEFAVKVDRVSAKRTQLVQTAAELLRTTPETTLELVNAAKDSAGVPRVATDSAAWMLFLGYLDSTVTELFSSFTTSVLVSFQQQLDGHWIETHGGMPLIECRLAIDAPQPAHLHAIPQSMDPLALGDTRSSLQQQQQHPHHQRRLSGSASPFLAGTTSGSHSPRVRRDSKPFADSSDDEAGHPMFGPGGLGGGGGSFYGDDRNNEDDDVASLASQPPLKRTVVLAPDLNSSIVAVVLHAIDEPFECAKRVNCVSRRPGTKFFTEMMQGRLLSSHRNAALQLLKDTQSRLDSFIGTLQPFAPLWDDDMITNVRKRLLEAGTKAVGNGVTRAATPTTADKLQPRRGTRNNNDNNAEIARKARSASAAAIPFYGLTLEDIDEEVKRFHALADRVNEIPAALSIDWLRIDCRALKTKLRQNAIECATALIRHVEARFIETMAETEEFMRHINRNLENDLLSSSSTDDGSSLRRVFELLRSIFRRNQEISQQIRPMAQGLHFLMRCPGQDKEALRQAEEKLLFLEPAWDALFKRSITVREQLSSMQDQEVNRIREHIAEFLEEIDKTTTRFQSSEVFQFQITPERAYTLLDYWFSEWQKRELRGKDFNEQQDLYDMNVTAFTQFDEIRDTLQALRNVWCVTDLVRHQTEEWMETPFGDVDASYLVEETRRLSQEFARMPAFAKKWRCFTGIEGRIKNLMTSLPLVQDLRSHAVRQRHWQDLMALCHMTYRADMDPSSSSFTLRQLLQLNLHNCAEDVARLVETAEKELAIERQLDKISALWARCHLELADHEALGCPLLVSIDTVVALLEDHVNALQAMQASRWVGYFRQTVARWQSLLACVDLTMTTWMEVQKQWKALQPIFIKSEDMRAQLPDDAAAFDKVDAQFRGIMAAAMAMPTPRRVVRTCNEDGVLVRIPVRQADSKHALRNRVRDRAEEQDAQPPVQLMTLLEVLEDLASVLARCEQSLIEYLEEKRRVFPRFYFLSNPDLIDILSSANDPPRVLSHISKIISSVETCVFAPDSTAVVVAVLSVENEFLPLVAPVRCVGKVEIWLQALLTATHRAVSAAIVDANIGYVDGLRVEWMFKHISQAVCVVARSHWTAETSLALEAVEDGNVSALLDHARHLKLQLASTIETVIGKLTAERRRALITLITIDVHCRDVVIELIEKRVETALAFAWQSQLRLYLSAPNAGKSFPAVLPGSPSSPSPLECGDATGKDPSSPTSISEGERFRPPCRAVICDSDLAHGSEYIGNCGCLVVTPLTGRCYITLTQALKLYKGGAPAGPAGTGKTETVKDIAHALGRPVYVFNCSDQMNYITVGSVFKGLAMSGAWGCFDEFNRIAVEVLSVVASQVKAVFDALRRRSPTFSLLGGSFPLSCDVGLFITMNPGYKGRTELPENIKSLFRPCAMVVPDVYNICEIMLSAEGFIGAKELAKKFVKLYQLNKELLSPQEHYDWGLRAMRAVLLIAGELKRRGPQLDESATLMRALRDTNKAKLHKGDVIMFMRLITALFPNVHAEEMRDANLEKAIDQAAAEASVSVGEGRVLVQKCSQLHELLKVRHSVFVMGPAGCGKSTVLNTLARALEISTGHRTHREVFDPKALSSNELYGAVSEQTREWRDGVLSRVFREYAANPRYKKSPCWIVLDGTIDSDWVESMNSVMDDNKLLTLASNERITMGPHMRLVFEVSHLHHATPATVSRAGILYINESDIGWGPMRDQWIAERPERYRSHLDILFDKHVGVFLAFQRRSIVPLSTMSHIRALCALLHGLLSSPQLDGIQSDHIEKVFLWCCIWAFGGPTPYAQGVVDYRGLFSLFIRREFALLRLPETGTVFDYFLRPNRDALVGSQDLEWVPWEALLPVTPKAGDEGSFSSTWNEATMSRLDVTQSPLTTMMTSTGLLSESALTMILPTTDTEKYTYLLRRLLPFGTPVMLVGSAGTGKSGIVQALMGSMIHTPLTIPNTAAAATSNGERRGDASPGGLDVTASFVGEGTMRESNMGEMSGFMDRTTTLSEAASLEVEFEVRQYHFCGFTDSIALQGQIERGLEKRSGRLFGPIGRKRLIAVLENVNLPLPDKYGSQSAVALLRQHMAHGYWHDRAKLTPKIVADVQYLGVMDHNAGVQRLEDRFSHRFLTLAVSFPSRDGLVKLMSAVLHRAFTALRLRDEVVDMIDTVAGATIDLWRAVQKAFPPTAQHFHYVFTMRDIARVAEGLTHMGPRDGCGVVASLWLHEVQRVFCDRLATLEHYNECVELCIGRVRSAFSTAPGADQLLAKLLSRMPAGTNVDASMMPLDDDDEDGAAAGQDDRFPQLRATVRGDSEKRNVNGSFGTDLAGATTRSAEGDLNAVGAATTTSKDGDAAANTVGSADSLARVASPVVSAATEEAGSGGEHINNVAGGYGHGPELNDDAPDSAVIIGPLFDASDARLESVQWRQYATYGDFRDDVRERLAQLGISTNLVLFNQALEQLIRIARIISMPRGHCMLVGVGGSGKQSLASLATRLAGFDLFRTKLSSNFGLADVLSDMSRVLRACVFRNSRICYLLDEGQCVIDAMLTFANEFLCTGTMDVFSSDERDEILARMSQELRVAGVLNYHDNALCRELLAEKCAAGLRIIYCAGPVVESLRATFRRFPGMSAMQLVYFHPWPEQALRQVGERFIENTEIATPLLRRAVCRHFAVVQRFAVEEYQALLTREQRRVYITPKTFLSFVQYYATLLERKRRDWNRSYSRLETGLSKLKGCAAAVATLQVDLRVFQEEARRKAAATAVLLDHVSNERGIVEEKKEVARREEAKTDKIVQEVDALVQECASDLEAARPIVEAARAALDTLDKSNLTELKSMGSPPKDVVSTCACVLALTAHGRVPSDRSWNASRRMMQDVSKWLKDLLAFDVDNIPQQNVDAIMSVVNEPTFTPEAIRSKSVAASSLCAWVVNVVKYHAVRCMVRPKEQRLAESRARLVVSTSQLRKVQAKVADLQAKLNAVVAQYDEAIEAKHAIEAMIRNTELKLQRAQRLVQSLAGERIRWAEGIAALNGAQTVILGDVLLTSSFVTYCGPLPSTYRSRLLAAWTADMRSHGIAFTPDVDLVSGVLFDSTAVAGWSNEGLAVGTFSLQNAAMLLSSPRFPLIVDPQRQGIQWLRNRGALAGNLVVLRQGTKNFQQQLMTCMANGSFTLVEDVRDIDPLLFPALSKEFVRRGRDLVFSTGGSDAEVVVHKDFMLCLHTAVSNPVYRPEVYAQATVINFSVTESGLEEQLLGCTVNLERPELEQTLTELHRSMNSMRIELSQCEDTLLHELSGATGDILENERLVHTLEDAKRRSVDIGIAFVDATDTKEKISRARETYLPVATRSALLFFRMNELYLVDANYQYSLDAFLGEFKRAILRSQQTTAVGLLGPPRIQALVKAVTEEVYAFVDRSLFARHRVIFATMVWLAVLERSGAVNPTHISFLLKGPKKFVVDIPEACKDWMSSTQWGYIQALTDVGDTHPPFSALVEDMNESSRWRMWAQSDRPEQEKLPGDWKQLTAFQKLLLLRCLRPDRAILAMEAQIDEAFSGFCFKDHALPLPVVLEQSSVLSPIMFILSPGSDPGKVVDAAGKQLGFSEQAGNIIHLSMGQGQEAGAEKCLHTAIKEGHWIVLHNVHLMKQWILWLERTVQMIASESVLKAAAAASSSSTSPIESGGSGNSSSVCHPNYRLFLTAEPVDHMPSSLMQLSVKLVSEPPAGVKSNFVRAYQLFSAEPWEQSTKPQEYHSCCFVLCFFHAVAVGRKQFGAAGWNRRYPFNFEDLTSCTDVLSTYLEERPRVPWEDLRYVFGEIMYGGHITDTWDRRLCAAYFAHFLRSEAIEATEIAPGVALPLTRSHAETLQSISDTFPDETPTLFSMNPLSETRSRTLEAAFVFESLLRVMPAQASATDGRGTRELLEAVAMLLGQVPDQVNLSEVEDRLDEDRTPYQHVFYQECERLNALVATMRVSLDELEGALKGTLTMTPELEEFLQDVHADRVPAVWRALWGATTRPLGSWTQLVAEASTQLSAWSMDLANPRVVFLHCFFIPVAFLTAILQDTALRVGAELDQMELAVEVTKKLPDQVDVGAREGAYIFGPSLEGAAWDTVGNALQEARLRDCQPVPVMWLRAVLSSKLDRSDCYACPMYATPERAGSYIATLHLKSKVPAQTWILRGAALILDGQ